MLALGNVWLFAANAFQGWLDAIVAVMPPASTSLPVTVTVASDAETLLNVNSKVCAIDVVTIATNIAKKNVNFLIGLNFG
jgi:hypothetical protein